MAVVYPVVLITKARYSRRFNARQVSFVSQQPTGMLLVGDVLFVAGELDFMAFDMRNSTPAAALSPPLLATCGSVCRQVGNATGQNFHSLGSAT